MQQYEDLFIKISEDFHNEINTVLSEIDPVVKDEFWFKNKNIKGKFWIINDLLLSINGTESKQYHLVQLKNTMETFKLKVKQYLNTHEIATCFVFFAPEKKCKRDEALSKFSEYSFRYLHATSMVYMIGLGIIGFPNDCSFKIVAIIKNNKIELKKNEYPIFEIEKEKGKLMYDVTRTRKEHDEIELSHCFQNLEYYQNEEEKIFSAFEVFSKEVLHEINSLLISFDDSIELCKKIINHKTISTPANLPEIQKIYNVLINGFIQDTFERFLAILQSDYSGEKLTWLKNGTELKFFVDRLNEKWALSNEINKWTGARFQLTKPVKNMTGYLSKQTSKDEYQLLVQGNLRKNPLYKLFRE